MLQLRSGSKRARNFSAIWMRPACSSSDGNGEFGEQTIRGRAGFRSKELNTIPESTREVKGMGGPNHQPICMYANFIKLTPMTGRQFYQYRVDFQPDVESLPIRKRLFHKVANELFEQKVAYDGMHDARSGKLVEALETRFSCIHPADNSALELIIKKVGTVSGSAELTRIYNVHMKMFLRQLGFYKISSSGAYVHPELANPIGSGNNIVAVLGYRTAANIHEGNNILMNLESVHKLMQKQNVLSYMMEFRNRPGDFKQEIKTALIGKLVVTKYNKIVYRIEDVNFSLNPMSHFLDRRQGREITYMEYYQTRYQAKITDDRQPLILVVQNNNRHGERPGSEESSNDIYLVPELCNIAGLTDAQRNDNRLKMDLIRSSQISPADRVKHLLEFLSKLNFNQDVSNTLQSWGYAYDKEPIKIKGRCLPIECIGMGRSAEQHHSRWSKVDPTGSFDREIQRECLAKVPQLKKLAILISRVDADNEATIIGKLRSGFTKIGLQPTQVDIHRMREGDAAHVYVQYIKRLTPDTTAALIILNRQNKERYDAIKKTASVEQGLLTQVVTAKLMTEERKAFGASIKIGVQLAAKLGGEPWYINLPLNAAMVCGYDTYHDTAHRGRSYGAFLASMNNKFSRWYSKADSHDRIDELSSHIAENLSAALRRYQQLNGNYPERVFIYRDGVSDGDLQHVYKTELKQIKQAIKNCETETNKIGLTVIIVNKKIGARFYMKTSVSFANPPPGTIIDDVVTRKERYDFYLISQSTRNGTVSPTYYNIIEDTSRLDANKHQAMAYKMCFLYYNWTGSVRVPAPCQYAHKLALLCGEHLHDIPNSQMDDKLHFL